MDRSESVEFIMKHVGRDMLGLIHSDVIFGLDKVSLHPNEPSPQKLNDRLATIIQKLGGIPRVLIHVDAEPKALIDPYPSSAVEELIQYHERTRRAVSRAAMTSLGVKEIVANEDRIMVPEGEAREQFLSLVHSTFWEHTETAYIRLASYWDRVGQLLAYAFFHIRQYERDGFAGVMQQIHQNIRPVDMTLLSQPGWNSLWGFYSAKPAKEDGFPWLASRRNMLVHRLHLRPIEGKKEDDFYQAMYDNLEETVRNKLKPAHPEKEVEMLIAQWSKINELFSDVLDVVERAAETRHKPIS